MVFVLVFMLGTVNTQESSYCCEKTIDGAFCQSASLSQCDSSFRSVQTSCEATAYCKLGTCVNSQEGLCFDNTPQSVCEKEEGVWYDQSSDELPQCQLGCCLAGDQAAYVTQTRCKTISSLYGLETNFRGDIQNEFECIASATSDVKGACVFEREYEKTCQLLTKRECQAMQASVDTEFHEGYLCSADALATNCGPRGGTSCSEDKVYFLDTCGNLANIYDNSKKNNPDYWTYIKGAEESCGYDQSNAGSRDCGNCDYYAGSVCKANRDTKGNAALYGDYVCADLSCDYKGETKEHGEVWCGTNTKKGLIFNLPGSEYFRLLCYNGDVTVEPCDPWRATVCVQSEV